MQCRISNTTSALRQNFCLILYIFRNCHIHFTGKNDFVFIQRRGSVTNHNSQHQEIMILGPLALQTLITQNYISPKLYFLLESHNLSNHSLLLLLLIDIPSAPFPAISVPAQILFFPRRSQYKFLIFLMKNHSIFNPLVWNEDIQKTGLGHSLGTTTLLQGGFCQDSHDILSKQDKHICF